MDTDGGQRRVEGAPYGIEVVTENDWPVVSNPGIAALSGRASISETECYATSSVLGPLGTR